MVNVTGDNDAVFSVVMLWYCAAHLTNSAAFDIVVTPADDA